MGASCVTGALPRSAADADSPSDALRALWITVRDLPVAQPSCSLVLFVDGSHRIFPGCLLHPDVRLCAVVEEEDGTLYFLRRQRHRITAMYSTDGQERWYHHGRLHRQTSNELPALVTKSGARVWYRHGRCHRDGVKPAYVSATGKHGWFRNGVFISISVIFGEQGDCCPICLEKDFPDNATTSSLFICCGCYRVFHEDCVVSWGEANGNHTCPTCRMHIHSRMPTLKREDASEIALVT